MSLRLFVDHCVPNSVVIAFRNSGHEVFLRKDEIGCDSDDAIVIAKAQELKSILVSLNRFRRHSSYTRLRDNSESLHCGLRITPK